MKGESVKSIFIKSIMSGILIGIGGIVYLSIDNKYLGAFLFSLGLFTIVQFGFSLFTGKVGYIPENKPDYIGNVLTTFIGNACGTAITAAAIIPTHIFYKIHKSAQAVIDLKVNDNIASQIILGIFCGMLMYIAVDNNKMCEKKDFSSVFGIVMPVMVFIMCGFNHSIADCFYLFAAYPTMKGLLYILVVAIGNALGGMFIPVMKKLAH